MRKIFDFFVSNKYAIFWTIGYFFIVWMILFFMFNFDFFNLEQWHKLIRANLRGFPGFVFGLLVLAAVPLYFATMIIIVRQKKPLIEVSLSNVKLPAALKKKPVKEIEKQEDEPEQKEEKTENKLPDDLPLEMKPIFLRAQQNLLFLQQTGGSLPDKSHKNDDDLNDLVDMLPVPSDFDLSLDDDQDETLEAYDSEQAMMFDTGVPNFKTIDFASDNSDDKDKNIFEKANSCVDNSKLVRHLSDKKIPFELDADVVVTNNFAIATHSDQDFWVPDDENWFAAGKVCESPIAVAKRVAMKYGVAPAVYFQAKNILDIDKLFVGCKSDGVLVVTNLDDL